MTNLIQKGDEDDAPAKKAIPNAISRRKTQIQNTYQRFRINQMLYKKGLTKRKY